MCPIINYLFYGIGMVFLLFVPLPFVLCMSLSPLTHNRLHGKSVVELSVSSVYSPHQDIAENCSEPEGIIAYHLRYRTIRNLASYAVHRPSWYPFRPTPKSVLQSTSHAPFPFQLAI